MISSKKYLLFVIGLLCFQLVVVQDSKGINRKWGSQEVYGDNIISISPLQFTSTSPAGLGVSYEHFLDMEGKFSLYIPAAISFSNSNKNYYGSFDDNDTSTAFWFYPGLKIYPTGSKKKVSYGVGPSLAIGAGTIMSSSGYDHHTGPYSFKNERFFELSIMVNNSINFQPTPKLYLGLEAGVSIPYTYCLPSSYSHVLLLQFNFKIGYRF